MAQRYEFFSFKLPIGYYKGHLYLILSGCVRDVFGMQVFVENKQDRCLFTKLKKCIVTLLSLLQNLPLAYYVATQQVKMYCYSAFAAPKFAFGLFCRDSTE